MLNKQVMIGFTLSVSTLAIQSSFAADVSVGLIDAFEANFGVTEGRRRNHTKGFCFDAELAPASPDIRKLSSSPIFQEPSKVTGRLSHSGGNSKASDTKIGGLGMALQIIAANGEEHRMAMNTLDFFPVSTPEGFLALNLAKKNGKEAMAAFIEKYPEFKTFKAHAGKKEKVLKPYEAHTYNSVNSFYLVNDANEKTAVRWSFVPQSTQAIVVEKGDDFFYDNIQANLKSGTIAWDMMVTVANNADPVDNAAIMWTGEHTVIKAATLTISAVATEKQGKCEAINFDPLVMSKGFAPSDDPILLARRPVYAVGFSRRMSER